MPERSITHGSFTMGRVYVASPARVFAAFADPKIKAQWFSGPDDWYDSGLELDFRVGGLERNSGGPKGEWVSQYDAVYHDIVPNERIVSTYDMRVDGKLISVSLATVELAAMPRTSALDRRLGGADRALGLECLLAGGDDYELCFTAPAGVAAALDALSAELGIALTRIGNIEQRAGLVVRDEHGRAFETLPAAFDHFRA